MGRRWAVACVVVWATGCGDGGNQKVRSVTDAIAVDPGSYDFGDVALGREERGEVVVRNDGVRTTTVDSIPGTARTPDFEVDGLPLALRAGEAVRLRVRFHPSTLGMRSSRFQLGTPVSSTTQDVDVRGHAVRGLAQLSVQSLDFGDVVLGKTVSLTFNLTNNDGHARTDIRIEPPAGADAGAFHSSREGAISLGAEESVTVQIDFTPARLGAAQATMQITPCPTCSPLPFVLSGNGVISLLDVQPPRIDFGLVRLGSPKEAAFTARNTSKRPLVVTGVTIPAGDYSVQLAGSPAFPLTLAPGQTISGTARFAPTQLGPQERHASIVASDGAPGDLDLLGTGYGPVIDARPNPLDLEAASIGTTRPKKLFLTNVGLDPTGQDPLVVQRVTLKGDPAVWSFSTPPLPWTIGQPGKQGVLTVRFTPNQPRQENAFLVIESNDGLHPSFEVPMTALGRTLLPCQVTVYPSTTVDFGLAPIFHPTTQGFELINSGSEDCIFGEPEITSGGPEFHWPGLVAPNGRTIPPGGRMSVRVEFTPQAAGDYRGQVEFYMSNPGLQAPVVNLRGTGDDGCFSVTPGAVDFGGTTPGCSLPEHFAYATNQCSAPVTVTAARITPGNFSISTIPGLPFTVAPNSQVPIGMRYTANTLGDDVASLQVWISTKAAAFQVGLTAGAVPPNTVLDKWEQSTPKVDMLIVIDNSGSMDDEQKALAANLDHLWNRIALANADFHIAVTSTAMTPYTAGWTQCPGGANGGEAGRFFPVDNSRPRILTPTTPNVKQALFDNTKVGLCHWDERFFDPVLAALTPPLVSSTKAPGTPWPDDGNAGFLRDDARLALLAVSDADDDNDVVNPPPVSEMVGKLSQVKKGALDLISFAGIVGLRMCNNVEQVGTRYMEIARQMNGKLYDICDLNNFGTMLDDALGTLLLPLSSFPLSAHPRDAAAIAVTVNGAARTDFRYDAGTNRIVFPQDALPPPGSHISATYDPNCN
ncbi:MAG: choice-of-anchor D domain-containing protein [Deltaproteobacteria bacterium]|nr:MAG: choice-of-anchor D domain-containing protein [Deltaproteobacteria bacterium]